MIGKKRERESKREIEREREKRYCRWVVDNALGQIMSNESMDSKSGPAFHEKLETTIFKLCV